MPSSLQKGINAAKAGQTEKALEHLKDAIIEEPQNADVWVWIAAIIDDQDKQEIFLIKALEIDPHNIPAQRGLSYLKKQNQHEEHIQGESLSDHTQPISPFPKQDHNVHQQAESPVIQLKSDALVNLTTGSAGKPKADAHEEKTREMLRLTAFEIVLLCVVVIVFTFIGLLASSALFDFDLPWGLLTGNRPRLTAEPPYQGVFLYEEQVFFDIDPHEGSPVANAGIPTSKSARPVILFWKLDADTESMKLIFESGTYVDFQSYRSGGEADLIRPLNDLQEGLHCLQETKQPKPESLDTFYCFEVNLSTGE